MKYQNRATTNYYKKILQKTCKIAHNNIRGKIYKEAAIIAKFECKTDAKYDAKYKSLLRVNITKNI